MNKFKNKNIKFPKKNREPSSEIRVRERLVIGIHAIREVFKVRPKKVTKVFIKKDWMSSKDLAEMVSEIKKRGIALEERTQENLDKFGSVNQGIACFVSETPELNLDEVLKLEHCVLIFLDGVEDPHNLGAVIRTSWLMDVKGVVIPAERAVGLTTTVHKVASGGVEHVPVYASSNFANIIDKLKENGFWVYGLSGNAKSTIFDLNLPNKVAWILGAEDKGMRTTSEKKCDELVKIPQLCDAASYNVSVATGIALSETFRQHSFKNKKI